MYKLIIIMFLFLMPITSAVDDTIIHAEITFTYDVESNIVRITGENLDWAETLNDSDVSQELDLILVRDIANYTEVTALMDICKENLNYSQRWQDCIDLNLDLDEQVRNSVNQSIYDECVTNVTSTYHKCELEKQTITSERNTKVTELEGLNTDIETQRNWLAITSIIGIGGIIYLMKKYKIWGQRETFTERDKPIETSF